MYCYFVCVFYGGLRVVLFFAKSPASSGDLGWRQLQRVDLEFLVRTRENSLCRTLVVFSCIVRMGLYLPLMPYGVKNYTLHCGHHKCHRKSTKLLKSGQVVKRQLLPVFGRAPSLTRAWGFLRGGTKAPLNRGSKGHWSLNRGSKGTGPLPIFGTFKV